MTVTEQAQASAEALADVGGKLDDLLADLVILEANALTTRNELLTRVHFGTDCTRPGPPWTPEAAADMAGVVCTEVEKLKTGLESLRALVSAQFLPPGSRPL